MPTEALFAAGSFIVLGLFWVVLPSVIRKRHESKVEKGE